MYSFIIIDYICAEDGDELESKLPFFLCSLSAGSVSVLLIFEIKRVLNLTFSNKFWSAECSDSPREHLSHRACLFNPTGSGCDSFISVLLLG